MGGYSFNPCWVRRELSTSASHHPTAWRRRGVSIPAGFEENYRPDTLKLVGSWLNDVSIPAGFEENYRPGPPHPKRSSRRVSIPAGFEENYRRLVGHRARAHRRGFNPCWVRRELSTPRTAGVGMTPTPQFQSLLGSKRTIDERNTVDTATSSRFQSLLGSKRTID